MPGRKIPGRKGRFKTGESCGRGYHTFVNRGTYDKCTTCGTSETHQPKRSKSINDYRKDRYLKQLAGM